MVVSPLLCAMKNGRSLEEGGGKVFLTIHLTNSFFGLFVCFLQFSPRPRISTPHPKCTLNPLCFLGNDGLWDARIVLEMPFPLRVPVRILLSQMSRDLSHLKIGEPWSFGGEWSCLDPFSASLSGN